ncbi:MAG: hypothetical protein HZC55_04025 [Verrucomicrobia bacterium]|nr:hypothetical protein [Verrucomicrobiota bacterium]
MAMLLGLLLAPLALLFAWGCGVVAWSVWSAGLTAGWHSGAVPVVLGCVVLGFLLLGLPRKSRR